MTVETFNRVFSFGFALVAFALVFLVLALSGCTRGKQFTEASGDSLPAPNDVVERQCFEGVYPEPQSVSAAEAERKLAGLEARLQAERGLRRMLNGNDE